MNSETLQKWLKQKPRPIKVTVHDEDGGVHEVSVQGPVPRIADTIIALRPEQLNALGSDGTVLRAMRPNDDAGDWANEDDPPQRPQHRARNPGMFPKLPDIPLASIDPESMRFILVAQLLSEAYRHATETAFDRLSDIVDSWSSRSEAVETARDQLHRAQIRVLQDQIENLGAVPAAGDEGLLGSMFAQFLGGAQAGRSGQAPQQSAAAAAGGAAPASTVQPANGAAAANGKGKS